MAEGSLRQRKKKPRVMGSFISGTVDGSFVIQISLYPLSMVGVTGAVPNKDGQYSEQAWEDRFWAFIIVIAT
jgi:hypothetical protein